MSQLYVLDYESGYYSVILQLEKQALKLMFIMVARGFNKLLWKGQI